MTEVKSYDLTLDVDFRSAFTRGLLKINLVNSEVPLQLDAVALEVEKVRVNGKDSAFEFDKKAGKLKIPRVPKGKAVVEIDYEKQVSDDVIFGFYKSKYGSNYMLVTDLEPAEARTVFPCKDEPAYKAIFKVTVTAEKSLKVISNSTIKRVKEAGGGKRTFIFNPSPKMSTYLFFLGIGNFEEVKRRSNDVDFIVASKPNQAKRTEFALEVGAKCLRVYNDYFGIRYPLEKLHLIALPEYHTGAMENWGAITSRESYLLLDENSSIFDKRYAADVLSHEIAHQWFGDLVTMKWWDDLWLNESFATFMGYKMIHRLYPKWEMWSEFLRTQTLASLNSDALLDTHPIQVHVDTPSDVAQVFDAISYGKGASVLRMMETFLGEQAFRKGVSGYLRKFSYSNARGEDLWKSLQKASGQPVSRLMGEWIRKPGFPLVKVSASEGKLKLEQKRFYLNGKEGRGVWPIPLTMELNGERKSIVFDRSSMEMPVSKVSSVKLNAEQTGFYSVLYDDATYEQLAKRFMLLGGFDRLGIMADLFLFLHAGKIVPERYFRFAGLCGKETNYTVLRGIVEQLGMTLYPIADDIKGVHEHLSRFALSQLDRLGLKPKRGEDPKDTIIRGDIAKLAVALDDEVARKLAPKFEHFQRVDPNMKDAVASAYAIVNGRAAYDPLVKMVKSLDSEVDRQKIYSGLGAFREPELVERTLELGISGEVSRSDSAHTLRQAAMNPYARAATWHWIMKRYQKLYDLYSGSQQIFLFLELSIPRAAVEYEDEAKSFLSGERLKQAEMTFKRTLERLHIYSELRKRLAAAN